MNQVRSIAVRLPAPSGARPTLYQLHLLRAFAVLLVVLDHAWLAASERFEVSAFSVQLAWLAGFLGVAIFFTISGYIMVETSSALPASPSNAKRFFVRRLMRIVPMYYFATAASVAFALGHLQSAAGMPSLQMIVCSLLFIPFPNAHHVMEPVLGQGWTLNNEMMFYLLFALSLLFRPRARPVVLVGVIVSCVAAVAIAEQLGHPVGQTVQFWAAPIALNFVSGLLLAANRRPRPAGRSPWLPLVLVAALSACLFGGVWLMSLQQPGYVLVFGWRLDLVVYAMSASACWLCTRTNTPLPRFGVKGRVARLGVALGDASYTAYLLHLFVIAAAIRVCVHAGAGLATTMLCCVVLALSITLVLHRMVEQPLNAWMRRPHRWPWAGQARVIRHAA